MNNWHEFQVSGNVKNVLNPSSKLGELVENIRRSEARTINRFDVTVWDV